MSLTLPQTFQNCVTKVVSTVYFINLNPFEGALAASAPMYWISGMKDDHDFWVKVTQDFAAFDNCEENIRHGFLELDLMAHDGKFDDFQGKV